MNNLNWILIFLCGIVILSYLFDILALRTRIPSVVLLIVVGIAARLSLDYFNIKIPSLDVILPTLGTLGLILIVLEGALDLTITRDNLGLIGRATTTSLLGLLITSGLIATLLNYSFDAEWHKCWLYAIPLSVISSAVAIPAAAHLSPRLKDFVIFESSISDIVGVLLFYAMLDGQGSFGARTTSTLVVTLISISVGIISSFTLHWLISRIDSHVRFIPLIAGIALIYAVGKLMHLSPLVIVMIVGLTLNNFRQISKLPFMHLIEQDKFHDEITPFKHLVAEATFIVRTFFFVLLGYSVHLADLAHLTTWLLTAALLICYLLPRAGLVKVFAENHNIDPLLWFAPKGLITILLILSLPEAETIASLPNGSIMLLILISALLLTYGNFRNHSQGDKVKITPTEFSSINSEGGQ